MSKREELITKVLIKAMLWGIPREYEEEMIALAEKLRVPAREDAIRNFVAAYCVVKGLMNATTADMVVASSSKGRRLWQKRIADALRGGRGDE